ncbi:MAG: hypothetical protein IJL05_00510 [Alphaproteobacteria bacterium]|nr:hypothetical protein [Alphaproteobacteria bacterium]
MITLQRIGMLKVPKSAEICMCTYKQLKCCLVFLLFTIVPYTSFALDACVENDAVAIVLDSNIGSNSWSTYDSNFSYNSTYMTFSDPFPYGTIKGIAACLSINLGYYQAYTDNNGVLIDNGKDVIGNERNGRYCWCKITYPFISRWHAIEPYSSLNDCVTYDGGCSQRCAGYLKNVAKFRAALYNSIQN